MIGTDANAPRRPDGADGVVAVHARHHDVGQDEIDVWCSFEDRECREPTLGHDHVGSSSFQERRQREHVAKVVVDDEDLPAGERGIVETVVAVPIRPRWSWLSRNAVVRDDERQRPCPRSRQDVGRHRARNERKECRERAPGAGRAPQGDLTAEQTDEPRLIDSPRPVPPYSRATVPSPCANASKIRRWCASSMPIPVSCTAKEMTLEADVSESVSLLHPDCASSMSRRTSPCSVNLHALAIRFFRTWRMRSGSVRRSAGQSSAISTEKASPFARAT